MKKIFCIYCVMRVDADWSLTSPSDNSSHFFFSSRRRHTRSYGDWSSDVCSSDLSRRQLIDPHFFSRCRDQRDSGRLAVRGGDHHAIQFLAIDQREERGCLGQREARKGVEHADLSGRKRHGEGGGGDGRITGLRNKSAVREVAKLWDEPQGNRRSRSQRYIGGSDDHRDWIGGALRQ